MAIRNFERDVAFSVINSELLKRYRISIRDHFVDPNVLLKLHSSPQGGFDFTAKDPDRLIADFRKTGNFIEDARSDFFGSLMALVTKGRGFREVGSPSIHLEVNFDICQIHQDLEGFVTRGPDGKLIYGPNMLAHGGTDLSRHFVKIMPNQLDLRLPNPSEGNQYGARWKLGGGVSIDATCKNPRELCKDYSVMINIRKRF